MVDGSSVTLPSACTLSGVTPLDRFATVASTSSVPATLPFVSGLPLATAGSKPAKLPAALTCAVSRATAASKVELRDRAAEDRRVVQRPVRRHVHRLGRGAAAAGGDVAVDRARVAIVGQRRHAELLADALQIEIRDGGVGAIREIRSVDRHAGRAARGDARAGDRSTAAKRKVDGQVRLGRRTRPTPTGVIVGVESVAAGGTLSSRGSWRRSTVRAWPWTSKATARSFVSKSGSVTSPATVADAP